MCQQDGTTSKASLIGNVILKKGEKTSEIRKNSGIPPKTFSLCSAAVFLTIVHCVHCREIQTMLWLSIWM